MTDQISHAQIMGGILDLTNKIGDLKSSVSRIEGEMVGIRSDIHANRGTASAALAEIKATNERVGKLEISKAKLIGWGGGAGLAGGGIFAGLAKWLPNILNGAN